MYDRLVERILIYQVLDISLFINIKGIVIGETGNSIGYLFIPRRG